MSEYVVLTTKLHARRYETWTQYIFYCPGCQEPHTYNGLRMNGEPLLWEFNGNNDAPSFTPSLLMNGDPRYVNPAVPRCHLFLTDGKIHYCSDCEHPLAGQTVDMVDYPTNWAD